MFQSTHPHGVRPFCSRGKSTTKTVSIHAPTRGATKHVKYFVIRILFQSTHPHGVRLFSISFTSLIKPMFQSTHPHGVRLMTPVISIFHSRFQSTHPHGVRRYWLNANNIDLPVSIHAPTRGATLYKVTYYKSIN